MSHLARSRSWFVVAWSQVGGLPHRRLQLSRDSSGGPPGSRRTRRAINDARRARLFLGRTNAFPLPADRGWLLIESSHHSYSLGSATAPTVQETHGAGRRSMYDRSRAGRSCSPIRWAPMKATTLAVIWFGSSVAVFAADRSCAACPSGETIQWIADYCMAKLETDDEIAASDCINEQERIVFRSTCAANRHFKRALCEVVVKSGARAGTIDGCVDDPSFAGPTVKRGGIGGQRGTSADGHPSLRPARRGAGALVSAKMMSDEFVTLYSERMVMRPVSQSDAGSLLEVFRDPGVRRYLLDDTLVSPEWVGDEIASSNVRFGTLGAGLWAIRLVDDHAIIGFVGFRNFFDPPRLQLLYGLLPEFWGQGLATEAARRVCDYAFSELGFDRIEAATDAPNERSIAVLVRLGMSLLRMPEVGSPGTVFHEIDPRSWRATHG